MLTIVFLCPTGILWRSPRIRRLLSRPPHPPRPSPPYLLRALRPDAPRPLQRDRRHAAQGRYW